LGWMFSRRRNWMLFLSSETGLLIGPLRNARLPRRGAGVYIGCTIAGSAGGCPSEKRRWRHVDLHQETSAHATFK
jgi:hypothetical protein